MHPVSKGQDFRSQRIARAADTNVSVAFFFFSRRTSFENFLLASYFFNERVDFPQKIFYAVLC